MALKNLNHVLVGPGDATNIEVTRPLVGPVEKSVTAAGTVYSDALAVTGQVVTVGTCGSGAGIRLSSVLGGTQRMIRNAGANLCNVYPPTGGTINGRSANVAFGLSVGSAVALACVDSLTIIGVPTDNPVNG